MKQVIRLALGGIAVGVSISPGYAYERAPDQEQDTRARSLAAEDGEQSRDVTVHQAHVEQQDTRLELLRR